MQTLLQFLPPTEGGYLLTMELNFNEADFLMHCIDLFTEYSECSFIDPGTKEVMLDFKQIEDLFLRIQDSKFARS